LQTAILFRHSEKNPERILHDCAYGPVRLRLCAELASITNSVTQSAKDPEFCMLTKPRQPEPTPAATPESPLVNNAKLRQIYTMMVQCRAFAEHLPAWIAEGHIAAALQPAAGQEALLAATAVDLRPGDALCFAPSDWLTAMLKGSPLTTLARFLLASTGSRRFKDAARHLRILPEDAEMQLTIAQESALMQKRRKGSLTVLYLTGNAPLDAWEKTLALTGRRRLPLLIVCRTPLLYESSHAIPPPGTLGSLAQTNGIPHIIVDGRDALAVYRVAQEANGRARRGIGATLIECQLEESVSLESRRSSAISDPIAGIESHLSSKGIFTPEWKEEILTGFIHSLNTALASASRGMQSAPAGTGQSSSKRASKSTSP
jgi:TPP-dependent pyruvate/acetoin dehydrogenase alpha subunit